MDSTISTPHKGVSTLMQVGLLAGPFLSMMDGNIVNVALPTVAQQLNITLATAQWIISSYLLALALILPASAYLARRFGTLRIYQYSLLGFTLASCACAFSPNIQVLIVARILQGAFGAPLSPLAIELLFSQKRVSKEMPAAAGLLLFLAPALGPTVGGILIHAGGWSSVFLINLPFGLLGLLGIRQLIRITEIQVDRTVHFDLPGFCLLAAGMTLTIYGSIASAQQGWLAIESWPFWSGGIVLLGSYVLWAHWYSRPVLNLKLVFHAQAALAVGISAIAAIVLFSMLVLAPIYMQDFQGLSPMVAGIALLPQGLVTGIGSILSGKLSRRLGIRRCVLAGMLLLTLSTALFFFVDLSTPAWLIALLLSGRGFALGLTMQPLLATFIHRLQPEELPDGNTLFNMVERLAGSVGIPLLITFFQQSELQQFNQVLGKIGVSLKQLPQNGIGQAIPSGLQGQLVQAIVAGFHQTIGLLVILSALGFLVTLFLRNPRQVVPAVNLPEQDLQVVVEQSTGGEQVVVEPPVVEQVAVELLAGEQVIVKPLLVEPPVVEQMTAQ